MYYQDPTVTQYEKINASHLQAGNFGRSSRNFSHPHKCAIYSKILPNRKTEIARHSSKLFCGSYSTNGDIFMSACQGTIYSAQQNLEDS